MEFARIARTALAAVVVTTTTIVALGAVAVPASAEKADLRANCGQGGAVLVVDLKGYGQANTIKVQDGDIVLEDREFAGSYAGRFPRPADVPHTFVITLRVPDNSRQSFVREVSTDTCVTPRGTAPTLTQTSAPPSGSSSAAPTTTTSVPTESGSSAPSSGESTSPTPPTTNTGVIPLGNKSDLSRAGASVAIPVLIGLCLISALGVIAFNLKRRRRSEDGDDDRIGDAAND
jgi:hypothetical protein